MATDHRGRALHAGKRTNQEMANAYSKSQGWHKSDYYDEDLGNSVMHVKGSTPSGERIGLVVQPNEEGTHTWTTQTEDATNPVSDTDKEKYAAGWGSGSRMITSLDLGRGKVSQSYFGSPNPRQTTGTAKTPMRAMIAAEAMKKRIEEGRDLKTGRPKD